MKKGILVKSTFFRFFTNTFAIGLGLGTGLITASVIAVTVSTTFTAGDILTADSLNALKTAIESIPGWAKGNSTTTDAVYTDGNVGIGTTSPLAPLHTLTGSEESVLAKFEGSVSNVNTDSITGVVLQSFDSNTVYGTYWRNFRGQGAVHSHLQLRLGILNGSEGYKDILSLQDNGNVGIGTTTPGFPLNFPNSLGDKISLWGQSGNHYGFGIQGALFQIHTDRSASDIAFGYGSSGSLTETMRIKGNGNVGIGTSSPEGALDVASTTGAFIVPRMTTTQRDALTAVNGMIIYNSTTAAFNFYENGSWVTK